MIRHVLRWLAAAGAFVVSLDSTVNVAFPAMAAAFHAPADSMRWVIIGYVLTYALLSFAGGAAGDALGHARVFRAGVAASAAGYLACGLAPTLGWLVAGRVVQGVGGGLIYGTSPALVTLGVDADRRGRALGFLAAAIGTAFAAGPLLAGVLVERFGWTAVFHVRLPLALALLAGSVALPRAPAKARGSRVWAREVRRPAVLRLGALAFAGNAGIFAIWLLAPFYLVERRGADAVTAGALFMLTPLGTAVAAPLAGRLADRLGARAPMAAGLALEAAGLGALSRAEAGTPAAVVALALLAAGFGLGVFQVPNMTALMACFAAGQQGAGGGFAFLARTLGTVAGVAVLAEVFARARPVVGFDAAFSTAFTLAAGAVALAAVAAALGGGAGAARAGG